MTKLRSTRVGSMTGCDTRPIVQVTHFKRIWERSSKNRVWRCLLAGSSSGQSWITCFYEHDELPDFVNAGIILIDWIIINGYW